MSPSKTKLFLNELFGGAWTTQNDDRTYHAIFLRSEFEPLKAFLDRHIPEAYSAHPRGKLHEVIIPSSTLPKLSEPQAEIREFTHKSVKDVVFGNEQVFAR